MSALNDYVDHGGPRSSDVLDAFRDHVHGLSAHERVLLAQQVELDPEYEDMPDLINTDDQGNLLPSSTPTLNLPPGINSNKNLVARSKSFGKERINCITLWFPPSSTVRKHSGAYSHSVAVLANNDRHVTVVGLESQDAMDEISYPDFVNRALISPDGQLLVAICDDPYLYVHKRAPKQTTGGLGPFVRKDLTGFEWTLCAKLHLKSQRKEDTTDQRGSFAACFSNTGRYLAVGTQYGVISVFETAAFGEPGLNPLITTFTSSRPNEDVGAVRDMAFCPGPFDILAWTEHRGRVGVADIRNNYVSRQILDLNKYDDYEQIMVTEQGSIDPRLLRRNDNGALTVAEPGDTAAARRLARRPTTERPAVETITLTTTAPARDYHPPLGADETMVLEALSAHRRRRDQMNTETSARNSPASGTRLLERLSNRGARGAFYRGLEDITRDRDRATSDRERAISDLDRARAQSERLRETAERVRARRLIDSARLVSSNSNVTNTAEARADAANLTSAAERAASVTAALRTLRQGIEPPGGRVWNTADVDTLYQNFDLLSGTDREGDGAAGPARDRDYLASVWSTILRNRGEETAEAIATATTANPRANRRLAERMAVNMNRMDHLHEHDDTAGLAWSEDGRVL